MAESSEAVAPGRRAIGRQIVLPLSKAFEIAWKGIRIRIWRSLITMSGIVLAIAFLMSVWTAGVFDRAMRRVPADHELFPLVQSALQAEAIAAGGVRVRCAVLAGSEEVVFGKVTPAEGIRSHLVGAEGFQAERVLPEPEAVTALFGAEQDVPDVLITEGLPPVLGEPEVAAALGRFVNDGGKLIVYGAAGVGPGGAYPLFELLPAAPADGTFAADGAQITIAPGAIQLRWAQHPRAVFLRTEGAAQAEPLAAAGQDVVAWQRKAGEGRVVWYVVDSSSAADPDVISWFVRGQTTQAPGALAQPGASPLLRLIARGLGAETETRDMRGIWLVTLSLMVCVVGITNAMLMSVTERFREIGTMKCLGALDKFVVKLFLIESSLQGVVGSLIGATVGFGLAFVRALFTYHVQDLETGTSHWLALQFFPGLRLAAWVGVALGVGIVLSVVAAIYPAFRAARMEPVQAMRVEA